MMNLSKLPKSIFSNIIKKGLLNNKKQIGIRFYTSNNSNGYLNNNHSNSTINYKGITFFKLPSTYRYFTSQLPPKGPFDHLKQQNKDNIVSGNKENKNNNKDNKDTTPDTTKEATQDTTKETTQDTTKEVTQDTENVEDEISKAVQKKQRASELKGFLGNASTVEQKEKEEEENKDEFVLGEPSTKYIYSVFTFAFIGLVTAAILNQYEIHNNSQTGLLGMQQFDFVLLLQDIYFGELKPTMEEGHPEFNRLTKRNFIFDEAGIRHSQTADTITLIVPILQKKTGAMLGNVNVDFVKEGKFMTIQNFYINAVNGGVYELTAPDEKIDTTRERYSGKYTLEELLTDPTL